MSTTYEIICKQEDTDGETALDEIIKETCAIAYIQEAKVSMDMRGWKCPYSIEMVISITNIWNHLQMEGNGSLTSEDTVVDENGQKA